MNFNFAANKSCERQPINLAKHQTLNLGLNIAYNFLLSLKIQCSALKSFQNSHCWIERILSRRDRTYYITKDVLYHKGFVISF